MSGSPLNSTGAVAGFRRGVLFFGVAAALAAAGCAWRGAPVENVEAARVGVGDSRLQDVFAAHWRWTLERDPLLATSMGEHAWDEQFPAVTAEARVAERRRRDEFRASLRRIPPDQLSPSDVLSRELLLWSLDADAGLDGCEFDTWSVSATSHPVATLNYLPELHSPKTPADAENLLLRLEASPAWIDAHGANLREGLAAGRVAPRQSVRLLVEALDRQLAQPASEWAMLPGFYAIEGAEALRARALATVDGPIRSAIVRYRGIVADEVLPRARPDEQSGVVYLPNGKACYAAAVARHTSVELSPATLHQTGRDELQRIHAEMREIGARALGTQDLAEIFRRLRDDAALRFGSRDELLEKAEGTLARAEAAVPAVFGRLPKTPCVVREIPEYEAPYTYVAYYRQPHGDGSKPGEYFVNTYLPETRLRHEAEVLAFHESVPGHHLQIALGQEMTDVPMFRRHFEPTVFIEGWALYTERLADEMGLYSGDLDRLGMLAFDAWRASRLVVDTGIHDLGWSRAQAEAFMQQNTPLAVNNIRNEVDRYIHWPGQALGYKTGQLEIRALRAEARAALGERFDLAGFHDAVLGRGAVTLPVLRAQVRAWIDSRSGDRAGDPPRR